MCYVTSVVSDSLRGFARLLCPWDSPGKNTGVGCQCPPPGDLPNPGSEPTCLLLPALVGRRRQWHPLQSSCLENPMEGAAWWAAVHGVATSRTRLSNFTFTFHFHALEKEMATHSSVLAWRISGTGEPGGLLSMGSHRVGHD